MGNVKDGTFDGAISDPSPAVISYALYTSQIITLLFMLVSPRELNDIEFLCMIHHIKGSINMYIYKHRRSWKNCCVGRGRLFPERYRC